jgi:cytochrome c2
MLSRLLVAACLVQVLAGCAGHGTGGAAMAIPDGDSAAAQLYINRCSTCHATPHPARHDYPAWLYLVPVMEAHMSERGMLGLTDTERATILAYLREYAR